MKLGQAFSDSVIIEAKTASRVGKIPPRAWWLGAGRALLFTTILFATLFILAWRLFDLTIIRGYELRALSDGNRTRELIRHAPRGRILDRTGRELAGNTPTYRFIMPCGNNTIAQCTKIIDASERATLIHQGLTPGAYIEDDFARYYPAGLATSHVIGYTGEISEKELKDPYFKLRGYRAGDRIGRMGAEAVYEDRLRGRDGRQLVEINASGVVTRTLGSVEAVPGEDITLSLDRSLSEAAQVAFPQEQKGAIIVSRPTTGELLALITSPTFDANIFTQPLSKDAYSKLFDDPALPMFNRAISGTYPPGSLFKIVTSIAGLEEKILTAKTLYEDTGEVVIGPFKFANWYFTKYGKTEGLVDIIKAIQRSNDIFFYKAGEAIGITKLALWAKRMGIGSPLGIEIPGEAGGLMPEPTWKLLRFDTPQDKIDRNDQWYLGDTYHVAIGQGYVLTTPLQANAWTNVVANGGKLCRPTIEKVKSEKSKVKSECKDLEIKTETIALITEGMKKTCETGGTGWPLFNFQITNLPAGKAGPNDQTTLLMPVACKTGTAEFGDPDNKTHAWFTVFAPINEPELSVTVLVEAAGDGSDKAAPIAKKILEEWFSR
ncbi:MAG: penicillin-binding transpeptidase domain-containing protein [Candidatus Gottesmanbacteria bacterium]|nr:penicillin-binding transpeptidase domain-containing protein [Candidatus Gottesmanbacteria bacterium]